MPAEDSFIPLHEGSENDFLTDEEFGGSNVEDLVSISDTDSDPAVDYWFGKMRLECTLAENLLCDSDSRMSSADIDVILRRLCHRKLPFADDLQSRLETRLRQYPHNTVLRSLQAQGLARDCADNWSSLTSEYGNEHARRALLTLIGTITRAGGMRERRALTLCLRNCKSPASQHHTQPRARPPPMPSRDAGETQADTQPGQDASPTQDHTIRQDLARFTMALKEHGDRIGEKPVYESSSKIHPRHQNWFKINVSWRGFNREGEAMTVRHAKDLASKKMCDAIGIGAW